MESKEASYRPLMTTESRDSESLTDCSDNLDGAVPLSRRQRWEAWTPSPILGALIFMTMLSFGLVVTILTRTQSDQQCARQLSMWSPALDAVEYIQIDFADAFNSTNIYRGPPIQEREDAWFNLTYKHAFEIPADRLSGMNRSEEDHLLHVPPKVGTGYVGLLEVYHQLHCLNIVRMYTW